MAHSGVGSYALGGGQGAISGAAAGASTGALFGPGGAAIGGVAGGVAGLGLGLLGTALDSKAQHEQEDALRQAEAEFEAAQKQYDRQVLQSGAAAREAVQQGMAAKGAADANAVSGAMTDAEQQADKAGLIGAEKADYVAGVRQRVERERTASSPAVYQQALGGARQEAQAGTQRAAIALQTAAGKYDSNVTQISGQNTTSASAAIGQSLGAVMQTAGALHGADISFAKGGGGATTPLTDAEISGLGAKGAAAGVSTGKAGGVATPMTDAEIGGLTAGELADDAEMDALMRGFQNPESKDTIATGATGGRPAARKQKLGGATTAAPGPMLGPEPPPGPAIPGYGSLVNPTGMGGLPYQSMDLMSPDELMAARYAPAPAAPGTYDTEAEALAAAGATVRGPRQGGTISQGSEWSMTEAGPTTPLGPGAYDTEAEALAAAGETVRGTGLGGTIPQGSEWSMTEAGTPAPVAPAPAPAAKRYGEVETPGRRLPTRTDRNERLPYHWINPDGSNATRPGQEIDTMAPPPVPAPTPAPTPVATPVATPAPVAAASAHVAGGVNSKALQPGYQWVWSDELMGYTQQPINYGIGGGIAGFASGGIAGAAGPEVAMLGEQGPELVLNAKQTQQLAQALPAAAPRPQAAPTQGGAQGVFSQTPEELEAYLEELLTRAS